MKKKLFFVFITASFSMLSMQSVAFWGKSTNQNHKLNILEKESSFFDNDSNITSEGSLASNDLATLAKISLLYQACQSCDVLPDYSLSKKEVELITERFKPVKSIVKRHNLFPVYPDQKKNLENLQPFPSRQECLEHKKYLASNFQAFKANYLAQHQDQGEKTLFAKWQKFQAQVAATQAQDQSQN